MDAFFFVDVCICSGRYAKDHQWARSGAKPLHPRAVSALFYLQSGIIPTTATERNNNRMTDYYSPCSEENSGKRQLFGF
jgi:hypothetical protein